MSFRDNLLHLRASHNMTQEQLAMMLGVSRQSVTKWESERSYPEMDKLLKLCQVFDCTLDELVQGDLTNRQPDPAASVVPGAPPADVFGYDEHARRFANRISAGVMTVLLAVAVSMLFFGSVESAHDALGGLRSFANLPAFSENLGAALGTMCILAGVAIALAFFIPAGMQHSAFMRAHPYIEDFYTPEQKASARSQFSAELIGGIVAVFAGICVLIVFADTAYEEMVGLPVMLGCIAVGVRFIVHGCMTLGRVNIDEYNKTAAEVLDAREIASSANMSPEQKAAMLSSQREAKRIGAVCGIIMITATVIALLMLFGATAAGIDDYSHGLITVFWLPWPIGGLLCGIATLAIKGFGKEEA